MTANAAPDAARWSDTARWPGALRCTAHTVPKDGRALSENEDSIAVNGAFGRFAVSDGASTAARSDVWSRLLADAFVWEKLDPLRAEVLADLRAHWWTAVSGTTALPWFAQAKLREGSAATFLGIAFGPGCFHARAAGDTCLLHLRRDELLSAGPIERAAEFSRSPSLVYTHPSKDMTDQHVWISEGCYQPGDTFVLATDAAAKYLLHQHEQDGAVPPLPRPGSRWEKFHNRVRELRATGQLDNDDTTVCVIRT